MRLSLLSKNMLDYMLVTQQEHKFVQTLFLTVFGSLFLFVAAKTSISFYPVPLNMESLAALFVGMAFGWRLGGLIVICHVLEGLSGMPVFAAPDAVGLAIFSLPTIGFVLGSLPAVVLSGYLVERGWGNSNLGAGLAAFVGMAVIYGFGLFFLLKNFSSTMMLSSGLFPFLFVDMLKILFLSFAIPLFYQYKQRKIVK